MAQPGSPTAAADAAVTVNPLYAGPVPAATPRDAMFNTADSAARSATFAVDSPSQRTGATAPAADGDGEVLTTNPDGSTTLTTTRTLPDGTVVTTTKTVVTTTEYVSDVSAAWSMGDAASRGFSGASGALAHEAAAAGGGMRRGAALGVAGVAHARESAGSGLNKTSFASRQDSAHGGAANGKQLDVVVHEGGRGEEGELPIEISRGLTTSEAQGLLKEYGRNELPEKTTPSWLMFLKQMWAPMPIMIWIAIIIELGIQNWVDAAILLAIQLINATIGWYETRKSGNAVAALKASLKPEATAKRDGKMVTIDAAELVPGDLVLLGSGSAVPADCMVNEGRIEIDQAALTGESLPVKMTRGDEPKMGSTAVRGEVEATVRYTGVNTFFGKTADLLNAKKGMDHLQRTLLLIVFVLTAISIVLCVTCFIYLMVKFGNFEEAIEFSVVVLVASIPLALEIVVTTTLALGSRELAKDGAIVTRLAAIEDLSGMNILCSDKTGTLTLNKMVIQKDTPTFLPGLDQAKLLVLAALAAKWREPARDALDTLVLNSAALDECDRYTQLDFTPFDPATKFTAGTVRDPDGHVFRVIKGAPQVILRMCGGGQRAAVEAAVTEFGARGIRTLAVARSDGDDDTYRFAGLLTFLDPPRADTKDTIHRAYAYGVDVKMITGDQTLIARETARQLAMGDNITEPQGLPEFKVGEDIPQDLGDRFGKMCFEADGFAQVYPEHKFLIVEALRQMGFGVGMTGDGVNDAPALKQADVGIAVEGATDAARAAADIVLSQPGLSTIITGIEVARMIFQRMQNFLTYRIAATLQLVFFFFIALIAFDPQEYEPASVTADPTQPAWPEFFFLPVILLILITVLNDGTMIAIGYDNVIAPNRPAKWNLKALFFVSAIMAAWSCLSSLLLLWFALTSYEDHVFRAFGLASMPYGKIVTMMYLKVAVSDFLTLFSARTGPRPFWATRPATLLLVGAGISLLVSTLLACLWPPGSLDGREIAGLTRGPGTGLWPLWVWLYCLVVFLLQDATKVATYWLMARFDIFHYSSAAMVATRDATSFSDPAAAHAAGYLETKALDAALQDGAGRIERLSRASARSDAASGNALSRVSTAMALSRQSLVRPSASGLQRKSLITVDESSTAAMDDVAEMQARLEAAAGQLGGAGGPEIAPYLARVSAAAERLRRVSAAVDRQRGGPAGTGLQRRSIMQRSSLEGARAGSLDGAKRV